MREEGGDGDGGREGGSEMGDGGRGRARGMDGGGGEGGI